MTTAEVKEYLRDIQFMRERLERLRLRRKELHLEVSFGSMNISGDRVMSTPENKMEKALVKLSDRLEKIDGETAKLTIEIDDRLNKIESLENNSYKIILFKRYSEYKSCEMIAEELNYNYNYVCTLHGDALKALRKKINNNKTS